jgi:Holliday junction resolvase RusA-like endonuclease
MIETRTELMFTVYGTPIPQGSMRAFIPKGWNRPVITAANAKTKPWRQEIANVVMHEIEKTGFEMIVGEAVFLRAHFYFDRPKSVKADHKITKPDYDKLLRSLSDALTGHVYKDDSQIVMCEVQKRFGSPARCVVTVGKMDFI